MFEPEIPTPPEGGSAPGRGRSTPRRALRWAVSLLSTIARYLFHRVPMYRRDRRGEEPPAVPDLDRELPGDPADVQRAGDGVGPLYHRVYRIAFTDADLGPEDLMSLLRRDINLATPKDMARFAPRRRGEQEVLPIEVGNEYVVYLPGPWNGPVRVAEVDDTSFTLVTLRGHMEAGQITFRARTHDEYGWTVFEIESFARSGSRLFHLLYHRLPLASEMQMHMWASFCTQVVRCAGGIEMTSVEASTHTYEVTPSASAADRYATTGRVSSRARRALDELHAKDLNFRLDDLHPSEEDGWKIDDWRQPLPSEAPGPPVPGGPFEVGRQLVAEYQFADPEIVRAVYHADKPLEDRDMVLVARFYGLKFFLGLRVGGIRDEQVEVDGRPAQVWGWNYRTLSGHLETGQMDYEMWKWTDTGEVEFRIHAFSKAARIPNVVIRLGMRIFGRWMQRRFARNALRRMDELVRARVGSADAGGTGAGDAGEPADTVDQITVEPAAQAGVTLPTGKAS